MDSEIFGLEHLESWFGLDPLQVFSLDSDSTLFWSQSWLELNYSGLNLDLDSNWAGLDYNTGSCYYGQEIIKS